MVLTLGIDIGILHLAATLANVVEGQPPQVLCCSLLRIGAAKDRIETLIKSLHAVLHSRQQALCPPGLERVVIEQQLGMKAVKNYTLSAILFSYYVDVGTRNNRPIDVAFVNPRAKFKIMSELQGIPGVSEHSARIRDSKGTALKKLAIEMSTALAKHWGSTVFLDKMARVIKQDDVADSFCMATLC